MEQVLLEVSVGTIMAGGALLYYVKKKKARIRSSILRKYTSDTEQDAGSEL